MKRTQSIEIARSPEDVFAFVTDPSKLGTWQDAEDVTQRTPAPLGVGSRLREVHKVAGRSCGSGRSRHLEPVMRSARSSCSGASTAGCKRALEAG